MDVRYNFLESSILRYERESARYVFPDLFKEVGGGNKLLSCWGIYAIKAGAIVGGELIFI